MPTSLLYAGTVNAPAYAHTMSQKSSVPQAAKFVSQALKRDTSTVLTTIITLLATDLGEISGQMRWALPKHASEKRTWPVALGFLLGCGIGASWEAKIELCALILPIDFALLARALAMTRQPGKSGD